MHKTSIQVPQPLAMQCVIANNNGIKETVTVAIVPVKITQLDAFTWQIGWACSRGRQCPVQECAYAYREGHR
jgi:hypothetical protein